MNRLRELRKQKGLTLKEAARKIKISTDSLAKYERGDREPKIYKWKKMADFYGVSVPYLQEVDETAVHNRLKELREQQGLTLDDIEAKAGITRGTYSNYENNKTEPKMKTWQNLADFYGVSVPYLQGYEQSTPHNRLKEIQGNVYSYYKNDDGTYVGILPVFDFEGQFYCIVDISRQTIITICKSKDEALKACESMKPVNLEIYLMED